MRYRWLIALVALFTALELIGCGGGPTRPGPETDGADGVRAEVTVRFLDIGQGDAALVQWPGGAALIDGGPETADGDLTRTLRAYGVQRLDYIIASHPHADHIGGLIDVLRKIPVRNFIDSGFNAGTQTQRRLLREIQRREGITFELARPGDAVRLAKGLTLHIHAPPETPIRGTESDANNSSIVGLLAYGDTRFLFTGDLQDDGRDALYETVRKGGGGLAALRADVLKVAHHGSHNGTDGAFLGRVRPRFAVISCGRGNPYGHPHREPLAALRKAGVATYRTDRQGDITMRTDGRTITVSTERQAR